MRFRVVSLTPITVVVVAIAACVPPPPSLPSPEPPSTALPREAPLPTERAQLEKRCSDDPHACHDLASLDARDGLHAERTAALLTKACAGNVAPSCRNLGFGYATGSWGLSKDLGKSVELEQKACDGGDQIGCFNLGTLLRNTPEVEDEPRAAAAFEKGCRLGHPQACEAATRPRQ